MNVVIPLTPPSGNHYVKHARNGRHYVTREALKFKEAVAVFVKGRSVPGKYFCMEVRIYLGKGERGDADNFCKVLMDSMQECGVFGGRSDANVKELHVYINRDAVNPRTEVSVEAMKRTPLKRGTKQLKRTRMKRAASKPTRITKDGRLILSLRGWQKMKRQMWSKPDPFDGQPGLVCRICFLQILEYEDFEPDHIVPRGMGGGTRDDRPNNIQPSHRWCNREKGSRRI